MDWLGYMHPTMVQIPMILFTMAAIADMLYAVNVKNALWIGHIGILLGAVFCIPAAFTGYGALDQMQSLSWRELQALDPRIAKHALLGICVLIGALVYGVVRIGWIRQSWSFNPFVFVVLSLLLLGLTYWTTVTGMH